jgi:hypothetical protein
VLKIHHLAQILLVLAENILVFAKQVFMLVLFFNRNIDFGLRKKLSLVLL